MATTTQGEERSPLPKPPLRRHSFKRAKTFTNRSLPKIPENRRNTETDQEEGRLNYPPVGRRNAVFGIPSVGRNLNKMTEVDIIKELGPDFFELEYERIRQSGRERFKELSRPREPKIEWWTNVGPNVMWGTQEMIWPVSRSIPDASGRVKELASPKKNFSTDTSSGRPIFYYSCGRPSMIWNLKPLQTKANVRVQELANAKAFHADHREDRKQYMFSCGRNTPIWQVSKGAKQADDRPRTRTLAEPKQPPKEYEGAKQIETVVPKAALKTEASERVLSLAAPKRRNEGPFREPQWPVSLSAKNAGATERCSELARAKTTSDMYQKPRDEMWPVSRAARRANATPRVEELSKPIVRASMDHVQFNPDAFLVKESALKGVVPKRVETLAQPIDR